MSLPEWPGDRAAEVLECLARASGLRTRDARLPPPPPAALRVDSAGDTALTRWLEAAAAWLELDLQPVSCSYAEVDAMLAQSGPALVRVIDGDQVRWIALLRGTGARLTVLGPDLRSHAVALEDLRARIAAHIEGVNNPSLDAVVEGLGLEDRAAARVKLALRKELVGSWRISGLYLLRTPPSASFWEMLREARLPRSAGALVLSHAALAALTAGAWFMLGRGALDGRLDTGWLLGWALLLLSTVPLRMLGVWAQGRVAIDGGAQLKRRLLHGTLRLEPEEIRVEGVGHLLGRVIESEAVEALALAGGLSAVLALLELAVAAWILAQGAGGALHAGALLGWSALAVGLGWLWLRHRDRWTAQRLDITHDLVERMVGHRTRLAQERPSRWHDGEDEAVARYAHASADMDRAAVALGVLVPRGWLVVALLALLPSFVAGEAPPQAFAVSVGGVLYALGALGGLTSGLVSLGGALIAWRQVSPLFHAARREERRGVPTYATSSHEAANAGANRESVVEGVSLRFRYPSRQEPVLDDCAVQIREGDRVLLEGPSGGGKSTLASLLVGLRAPDAGLLLLRGLDQATLGAATWRRRVVAAPQFHENHVLTETFAFNLLMGRGWPADDAAMNEASELCTALGLGPLLERMPAGLLQMVGETGWQLSHGERSRLFLARALLQGADLVVLDESFAALDPENLTKALECTLARVRTVVVIAHP